MSDLASTLAPERLVDLTQRLGPATVLWPGSTPFAALTTEDHETHGMYARDLALPEHTGTHLDAPAHFAAGGASVDELALSSLIAPVARLDARSTVAAGARELGIGLVEADEADNGRIAPGSVAVFCTGWDAYISDPSAYLGEPLDFPGLSVDAAHLLVARGVVGIGIDTPGVDPGHSLEFPVHRLTLPAGLWHLEGLVALDRLPPRGAWLIAAVIPVVAGSGAPARAFAILPAPPG